MADELFTHAYIESGDSTEQPVPPPADVSASADVAAEEDDAQASEEPSTEEPEAPEAEPRPNRLQQRFGELTRARDEARAAADAARAEAQYWRERAAREAPSAPSASAEADAELDVPALVAREVAQRLAIERQATVWQQRLASAQAQHADFADVVSAATVEVAPHVSQGITESEHGGELLYYLAQHPDEVARLNRLPEAQAMRALGRLEARFEAPIAESVPATKAPPPVTPTRSSARIPANEDAMPLHEWIAMRNKQERERQRT